jgi:hypothetical protein
VVKRARDKLRALDDVMTRKPHMAEYKSNKSPFLGNQK